jgi:LEA14-like dessication related protein
LDKEIRFGKVNVCLLPVKTIILRLYEEHNDSYQLYAQISFYNPNPYNLELKRGDVNVFLNDQLANHYQLDSTIYIPKKDTFYVPLNLKISPKLLISSAISMLMNNNKIKLRLEGSVHVKRSGITFKIPLNYEVMQSLQ